MKTIEIKGKIIGQGKPVICVPVTEPTEEAIIAKIKRLGENEMVEMIEWRVDTFEGVDVPEKVKFLLQDVKDFVKDTVFLFTFRTVMQGGNKPMPEKNILRLNEIAAKSGVVDMVDLEFFEATRPEKEIARFQRMGVKIIASHHDFDGTPDDRILSMLLDQMVHGGADIAKLAVMPNDTNDVIRLLKVTDDFKHEYPDNLFVTMSMGGMGAISRISGEVFGSCITFGADGAGSAPGQLQMDVLAEVLDVIHKGM